MRYLLVLLLAGCANGVQMTDEEVIACRNDGCIPFTETELRALAAKVYQDGYLNGWKDANRQGGRSL